MRVGYARTSMVEQVAGLEAQEKELRASGVEKLFIERVSSVAKREKLEAALDFCREGDALVVTKLDRLARSMADLIGITAKLTTKGVDLQVLGMGLDTATATGKLIVNIMGAIAEFERSVMLERQKEGIAKAKAEGKFKGRAPTAQRGAPGEVIFLREQGLFALPEPSRAQPQSPILPPAEITAIRESSAAEDRVPGREIVGHRS